MLGFTACSDDTENRPDPSITFGPSVEATSAGGAMEMAYTLKNPTSNALPTAECAASWVKNLTVTDGKITFSLEPNPEIADRSAEVAVTYNGEVKRFTITQTPTFKFNVEEIGYDVAYLTLWPETETITYLFDYIKKADYDAQFTTDAAYFTFVTDKIKDFLANGSRQYTFEEWLELGGALTGSRPMALGNIAGNKPLDTDTEYYATAFGISLSGELTSCVCKIMFKTNAVAPSSNQITINVANVKTYAADITTVVTNDDPYLIVLDKAANLEGLSDEQVMTGFLSATRSALTYQYVHGSGTTPLPIPLLEPETEYVVYAFGMQYRTPTTGLVRTSFTTEAPVPTEVTAKVVFTKWFDKNDYDPNTANDTWSYLPVWVETTGIVSGFKYSVYPYDLSASTDEQLKAALMGSGLTKPKQVYTIKFGPICLIALALDMDGNPGPLFRSQIVLSAAGVSPASEFNYDPTHPEDWDPETLKGANPSSFLVKTPAQHVVMDLETMIKRGPVQLR